MSNTPMRPAVAGPLEQGCERAADKWETLAEDAAYCGDTFRRQSLHASADVMYARADWYRRLAHYWRARASVAPSDGARA